MISPMVPIFLYSSRSYRPSERRGQLAGRGRYAIPSIFEFFRNARINMAGLREVIWMDPCCSEKFPHRWWKILRGRRLSIILFTQTTVFRELLIHVMRTFFCAEVAVKDLYERSDGFLTCEQWMFQYRFSLSMRIVSIQSECCLQRTIEHKKPSGSRTVRRRPLWRHSTGPLSVGSAYPQRPMRVLDVSPLLAHAHRLLQRWLVCRDSALQRSP